MKIKVFFASFGLALLVGVHLTAVLTSAVAQGDDGGPQPIASRALAAAVDYGNDNIFYPAKSGTDFERFGLDPQQTVTLTVQFPVELAGQLVFGEPLDGGTLYLPEEGLFVGNDGNVTFQFRAGEASGACRISVHQPDDMNILQFWVIDPEHPENTPPNLPGVY